uniref:BED-type domain-containing protein n=1 Tax=Acrobeloides nanus TaxID=290746 RepID=A0A914E510_9BILA
MCKPDRTFIECQINTIRDELITATDKLRKAELILESLRLCNINLFEENERLQKEIYELRNMRQAEASPSTIIAQIESLSNEMTNNVPEIKIEEEEEFEYLQQDPSICLYNQFDETNNQSNISISGEAYQGQHDSYHLEDFIMQPSTSAGPSFGTLSSKKKLLTKKLNQTTNAQFPLSIFDHRNEVQQPIKKKRIPPKKTAWQNAKHFQSIDDFKKWLAAECDSTMRLSEKIKCKLCLKILNRVHTTDGKRHLKSTHIEEYKEVEEADKIYKRRWQ